MDICVASYLVKHRDNFTFTYLYFKYWCGNDVLQCILKELSSFKIYELLIWNKTRNTI